MTQFPSQEHRPTPTPNPPLPTQPGLVLEGFELLESEAVVSLKARRGGLEKPPYQPREAREGIGFVGEPVRVD